MRIGIVSALWQRPRLAQLFLNYYASLDVQGVELVLSCTVSPEDETLSQLSIPPAWNVEQYPNTDVSQKFNRSMRYMAGQGVEGVIILGSDDFICPRYIHMVERKLYAGVDYIRPHSLYLHDLETREVTYLSVCNAGAGRAYSRRVLERSNWLAWPSGVNRKLDAAQTRFIGKHIDSQVMVNLVKERVALIDVKGSGVNMWTYKEIAKRGRPMQIGAEVFWNKHFGSIADEVLAW